MVHSKRILAIKITTASLWIATAALIIGVTIAPLIAWGAVTAGGGGGTSGGGSNTSGGGFVTPDVSNYLSRLYLWFLGFVGISALFGLVTGGILYMFAGANITKTDQARTWIKNAISGIILAAISFLLLNTINPELVKHGFDIGAVLDQNPVGQR